MLPLCTVRVLNATRPKETALGATAKHYKILHASRITVYRRRVRGENCWLAPLGPAAWSAWSRHRRCDPLDPATSLSHCEPTEKLSRLDKASRHRMSKRVKGLMALKLGGAPSTCLCPC